jgi:dTDP-4-dehydrorhamnose 3,5-epimerase
VKFSQTPVAGAWLVEIEPLADERGFFARSFCAQDFAAHGLSPSFAQWSISHNTSAGTLRGLHYQAQPHAEAKLVRCTRGAIYDVVLDLRRGTPGFGRWHAVELSAQNRCALYVPEGCAHGFQTLLDDSEVSYSISTPFVAAAARGVRWNDPAFGIIWPLPVGMISARDRELADFTDSGA